MENSIQEILDRIDKERTWRKLELDNLNNILNRLSDDDEKNIIRKSIILMSYSHFEGFFKYSFIQYTGFLNEIKIPLGKAIDVLVVSTLNQAFTTYDDQKIKNTESKSDDIETTYQKILDNRITFVKRIDENRKNDIVNLAAEATVLTKIGKKAAIVDTESNLSIEVVTKILLRLGMPHNFNLQKEDYNELKGKINMLLNIRNSLAHTGKFPEDYTNSQIKCTEAFDKIAGLVYKIIKTALVQKLFIDEKFRSDSNQQSLF